MELTTSFKTGLRALVLLARSHGRRRSAKSLAADLGTSEKYVEQVLIPLRRANIVQSRRGPDGGYVLAQPAAQIPLSDVFGALQGPFALCSCADGQCGDCVRPELWRSLEACWEATLHTVTLAHLASGSELIVRPGQPTLVVNPLYQDGAGI